MVRFFYMMGVEVCTMLKVCKWMIGANIISVELRREA